MHWSVFFAAELYAPTITTLPEHDRFFSIVLPYNVTEVLSVRATLPPNELPKQAVSGKPMFTAVAFWETLKLPPTVDPQIRLAVAPEAIDRIVRVPEIVVPVPSENAVLPFRLTFPVTRVPFKDRVPPCTLILPLTAPPRNEQFWPNDTVSVPEKEPL